MTTTTQPLIDQVEEALAMLWFHMDHIGNARFQEEIEEVSDAFPEPEGSASARSIVRRAHDLFQRVHAFYSPRTQRRTGHTLVRCPHCSCGGEVGP